MSLHEDMRRGAMRQVDIALHGSNKDGIMASLAVGVIYALLAIAAAIADLKP